MGAITRTESAQADSNTPIARPRASKATRSPIQVWPAVVNAATPAVTSANPRVNTRREPPSGATAQPTAATRTPPASHRRSRPRSRSGPIRIDDRPASSARPAARLMVAMSAPMPRPMAGRKGYTQRSAALAVSLAPVRPSTVLRTTVWSTTDGSWAASVVTVRPLFPPADSRASGLYIRSPMGSIPYAGPLGGAS